MRSAQLSAFDATLRTDAVSASHSPLSSSTLPGKLLGFILHELRPPAVRVHAEMTFQMDEHLTRPARSAHTLVHLTCLCFRRVFRSCWRFSRSRRAFLLAFACLLYLFCVELRISPGEHDRNLTKSRKWILEKIPRSPSPTHSNVVYITLKSKRHKPAILRATVRSKSRRKKVRNQVENHSQDTTHHHHEHGEEGLRHAESRDPWRLVLRSFSKPGQLNHNDVADDNDGNSIRIYSQTSPPWFSQADIETMRFLSKCKIRHVEVLEPEDSPPMLLFKSVSGFNQNLGRAGGCDGQCGVIRRPEDMSEVFAFHLDRVLGLNRTLVSISRRFRALDGQLCLVNLYDPSVVPVPESRSGSVRWSSYQTSLQYRCWQRGVPRPEWNCSSLHHHEWSKVALFDFLLQNHQRLDRNCCGFRPRPQDSCVQLGYHRHCTNAQNLELSHIVHRKTDPRRLVYINNNAFFDRGEENLDFQLLEGIKELPDAAVSVLRSPRLRQNLLQSLFVDEQFWENQGGRRGIDKLIDVIERRVRVLLRYINAHGIDIVAMNT